MAEEVKTKPIALGIGIFILLALVGTTYLIQTDNAYMCSDNNQTIIGLCFKLSAINSDGIQTRCYYDLNNTRLYKYCKIGWIKFENESVIGGETNITTYIEYTKASLQTDFARKIDAEEYVVNLKKEIKSNVTVLRTEQYPFSNEKRIYWNVIMYTELFREENKTIIVTREVLNEETLYSTFIENATDVQVNETINKNAMEYISRWTPSIII